MFCHVLPVFGVAPNLPRCRNPCFDETDQKVKCHADHWDARKEIVKGRDLQGQTNDTITKQNLKHFKDLQTQPPYTSNIFKYLQISSNIFKYLQISSNIFKLDTHSESFQISFHNGIFPEGTWRASDIPLDDDWFHIAKPFPYVGHVGKV